MAPARGGAVDVVPGARRRHGSLRRVRAPSPAAPSRWHAARSATHEIARTNGKLFMMSSVWVPSRVAPVSRTPLSRRRQKGLRPDVTGVTRGQSTRPPPLPERAEAGIIGAP